jgi:DNA polymerase-4
MSIKIALRLCSQAKVMKGDMELYSKLSHDITEVIEEKVRIVEKASFDEFYLDNTVMEKFYGGYKWTNELAHSVTKETRLPISFALSINKTVSKIGTSEAKPKGNPEIPENMVSSFLNPLSIQKIPMVGDVTFQLLSRIGIRTIQTLSEMPAKVLRRMIGKNGIDIWKKANGIDNNPVEPYTEWKSISTEYAFNQDTINIPKLKSTLIVMVEKMAFQLLSEEWLTSTVVIKIHYTNFDKEIKQCKIAYTSANHMLNKTVTDLFDKVYQRYMRFCRALILLLKRLIGSCRQIKYYGIKDLNEATAYLEHPILGKHVVEISEELLKLNEKTATQIFGTPDDMKLRSCMILFANVKNSDPVFQKVLTKYFNGLPDDRTAQLL